MSFNVQIQVVCRSIYSCFLYFRHADHQLPTLIHYKTTAHTLSSAECPAVLDLENTTQLQMNSLPVFSVRQNRLHPTVTN